MDNKPLVSVIIPTFNAEPWIRETLDSVFSQTFPSYEVIVVDDCSQDETKSILASYGNRIRFIENNTNQGVSISRNQGINASQGDYVALLDHDDLWHPKKLEKQMALFNIHHDLGLVYSDAFYVGGIQSNRRSFQINPPHRGHAFTQLLRENFILCLTAVIPRRVLDQIGQFHPDFHCGEDYDLFLRIAERFSIDYVDEPLATYRVHSQNFSHRKDVYFSEWIRILNSHRSHPGVKGTMSMVYIRWARENWKLGHQGMKGLPRFIAGIMLGLQAPLEFIRSFQDAMQQKRQAQLNKRK